MSDLDPMLQFEREVAESGFVRIAGVDEAGRGPLAGPIVAGAVVLGEATQGFNDSKQLSARQRDELYDILLAGEHTTGLGIVEADVIDRVGIQSANYKAMLDAAQQVTPPPDFLLVDGFEIRGCAIPQKGIVKGDARSYSIAAASILAKVTRDRMMDALDVRYPEYGFARHKGYGTKEHLKALERHGPCPAHRRSFAPLCKTRETDLLF